MPLNMRMLGPTAVGQQTRRVHGRTYTAAAGQVITVPAADGERLQANGWVTIALSGTTALRPSSRLGQYSARHSLLFWDETLGQMIVYDGVTWRDPTSGNAI